MSGKAVENDFLFDFLDSIDVDERKKEADVRTFSEFVNSLEVFENRYGRLFGGEESIFSFCF